MSSMSASPILKFIFRNILSVEGQSQQGTDHGPVTSSQSTSAASGSLTIQRLPVVDLVFPAAGWLIVVNLNQTGKEMLDYFSHGDCERKTMGVNGFSARSRENQEVIEVQASDLYTTA